MYPPRSSEPESPLASSLLRGVLDTVPAAVVFFDGRGQPLLANRCAREVLGELAGAPIDRWVRSARFLSRDGQPLDPDELPAQATLIDHAARREIELQLARDMKPALPVLMSTEAVLDPAGLVRHVAVVLLPIPERVRREASARRSLRMDSVARLALGVAGPLHDALTAVTGWCDILDDRMPDPDPMREVVHEIRSASERATGLTQHLLTHAQQEVPVPRRLDIDTWLRTRTSLVRGVAGDAITLAPVPGAEGAVVEADPRLLDQVLVDLVSNARDAMAGEGRLGLETRTVRIDASAVLLHGNAPPGDYVIISVTDTGPGMDDRMVPMLFEPFFTTKPRALGLGLTAVDRIVRAHDGHLRVERRRAGGTTFHVYLPRTREAADPLVHDERPDDLGLEVLVVEDDAVVRDLVRHTLEEAGCRVREAASAAEAERVLEDAARPLDLLVGDVVVPGGGGLSLVDRLRTRQPGLHALLVSGCGERDVLAPILQRSDVTFLPKPFGPGALLEAVERAVAEAGRGAAA